MPGIQMWLRIQICKWLIVSVNNAPMPLEVLSPLHVSLIDGQQLMVSDMTPGFSRGKLLTIERNWLSILQQLGPYSLITDISSQINPEGPGVVW